MADITLDPDDDPDPELFSSGGAASAAAIGAWAWAALEVKNDNVDASAPAVRVCALFVVSNFTYLFRRHLRVFTRYVYGLVFFFLPARLA
jgi:hypothetical protein